MLEAEYDSYLSAHSPLRQSVARLRAPTSSADSVTLTLGVSLERVAKNAFVGRDGAAVVAVLPLRACWATAATVVGPMMRCLVAGALSLPSGRPA